MLPQLHVTRRCALIAFPSFRLLHARSPSFPALHSPFFPIHCHNHLHSASIILCYQASIDNWHLKADNSSSTTIMMSKFILAASALVAVAHAQTLETSSASSVAATSTVSQVMPPAATASFNPAGISSTDACKSRPWRHLTNEY